MENWISTCVEIYQQCVRQTVLCTAHLSLFHPLLSLFCFLQRAWFLMVGGDRSFKLALKEENEEFSDELREDCEVREEREGRGGLGGGEGVEREGAEGRGGDPSH